MSVLANNVDLTTVAAAQSFANVTAASAPQLSDQYQALITSISKWIATYCSNNFDQRTYAETRNGRGQALLGLRNGPVTAVSSLVNDGVAILPATGPPWNNGYVFSTHNIALYGYCFSRCYAGIQIAYTAGYITPGMNALDPVTYPTVNLPQDLQQACIETVADRFYSKSNIGVLSRTLATETVSYTNLNMPPSAKLVIDRYMRKVPPL